MNQLQVMEPQFECGLFEIWCLGIIDTLVYRANSGLDDIPYSVDFSLSLEERLAKCEKYLDLPGIRSMKPELYEIILSKTGFLVRKHCADLCDPCDRLTFKSRFIDLIFLNVLREKKLLTQSTQYFYESILDTFCETTFGLSFVINLVADQGWYRYESKFLSRFNDPDQIKLITTELHTLSSDFHLNLLFVIWHIESVLNDDGNLTFDEFKDAADHLLNQSLVKTYDFRNNLAIYLALINVTLEGFIGSSARKAACMLGLDKHHETEDPVKPIFPKVTVEISSIGEITRFINDLGRNLFPNHELEDTNNLKRCLKDPKSETIVEMIAVIFELNSFISVLRKEISLPEFQFEGFDTIIKGWDEWAQSVNIDEILCQEVLTLKRFFTLDRAECRYLTCVVIKHGLPKYFDILESIDIELYLDPYVLYTFCDILQMESLKEASVDLVQDLILTLKRILTSIKSKKKIVALVKSRANYFGLYTLGNVKKTKLSALLRQQTGGIKYDQIRDEILLAAFLAPYELLDFIVADSVEHAHQMIPFLTKLFCVELNGLMSSHCETIYDNTLLEIIINTRLSLLPTQNTIQGLLKLIKEIFLFYVHAKEPVEPAILTLERLMFLLAWDGSIDTQTTTYAKLAVYKLIQTLSNQYDHVVWNLAQKEPASLLYSMITMVEYCYEDGSRKVSFIDLIAFIMNKKVQRKLTSCEWNWIKTRMDELGENSILLAYLEPWLPERLSFYFNVKELSLNDTLVLASICKNNLWISQLTRHDLDGEKTFIAKAIGNFMRFLHRPEYDNLFFFLCHANQIDLAMLAMCDGYAQQDIAVGINTHYETECLLDCIYSHYLEYLKNPEKYIPETRRNLSSYYISESHLLPLLFRRIQLCLYYRDEKPNKRLDNFLVELSREMSEKEIDVNKAMFREELFYHDHAIYILRMYHSYCFTVPRPHTIRLAPI